LVIRKSTNREGKRYKNSLRQTRLVPVQKEGPKRADFNKQKVAKGGANESY